jgi:pyruvate dehydrogenase E1 component beta subunit
MKSKQDEIDKSHPEMVDGSISYREALHQVMRNGLLDHPNVIIMGQGVDDHKGFFGSTLGLGKEFGADRVFDTPLAEEAMAGVALGAALNGLYPIYTHLRVDFALCCMNQIVNLIAKYKYMFGGRFSVPMMIRMVIGRSWGQGSQHSQSLQSLFSHIPGLVVIMPSTARSILEYYSHIISNIKTPVIAIEHRLLYDIRFRTDEGKISGTSPINNSLKIREGKDITIVATSIMVLEAQRAAQYLSSTAGIECEIIDLNCISHPDTNMIVESVKKTGKLIVADTSWQAYGVCAEICRIICENSPNSLKSPVVTLGMQPATCPTAKILEDSFYPNLHTLTNAIARIVRCRVNHNIPLPDENSMADVYKKFKGPF